MTKDILNNKNIQAFLKTISFSEGTNTSMGYRTMFTGKIFNSFTDHPRQIQVANGLRSDAAGRYQLMSYTWDELKKKLNLIDFSPESQDLCACELLNEHNSLNDVCNGSFNIAIQKCCTIWASFPDLNKNGASHYGGQPSHSLKDLKDFYIKSGGTII